MAVNRDLIRRSGDLKRDLVRFALGRRFARAFRRAQTERFGTRGGRSEGDAANFLDFFILQQRLPDGGIVLDQFIAAQPELAEADRALLQRWHEVVEGIFEVQAREGDVLVLVNLVDELTYRVYSNMGPQVWDTTPVGSFLMSRLVPIADDWLVSGFLSTWPAKDRTAVYRLAADLAQQYPALVFRNPKKLEQGWAFQREERAAFMAFFGSDVIVVPGRDVPERLRAYHHFLMYELRDADGQTAADRARQTYGTTPPLPAIDLPAEVVAAESVGVIFDEIDGMNFLNDFGLVAAAFADPARAAEPQYREIVRTYLEDPSISPRLLRRLADADPARASEVFRRVLDRPDFWWAQDGDALLQRYKAGYFAHPVLPSVTPVNDALARTRLTRSRAKKG
jgi:hypothetical protein